MSTQTEEIELINELDRVGSILPAKLQVKENNTNTKIKPEISHIKGYIFGFLFTILSCISNILIKMSVSLNSFNHATIRYIIQLFVMLLVIKKLGINPLGPINQRKLLILRGFTGCTALIFSYYSLKYLDVSDVETLVNSSVLFTAIFGRIFLKEKITICHIFATIFTFVGVGFVLRPAFLFGIEYNLEEFFHVNLTSHNNRSNQQTYFTRSIEETSLGMIFVFIYTIG
jgi:uncharacterized membrane protein